nr:hypothetical protein [Tanacetum cinerariifolium]
MQGEQLQLEIGEFRTELAMQILDNGVVLDEEELLFNTDGQDNTFDDDVDEAPVQDLALHVDQVFHADQFDTFDSDVDEAPTTQTIFMASQSLVDPIYDEAGLSYDSDILYVIVSQLVILGENISQEDLNLKFLRSLPAEWNTHVMVWRNKPGLGTISFDGLYNNFKIVEQEVKGTANSSSISSSLNMAFVSSPSSTNEVNNAYRVSTANTQVSPTSTQVSTASTQVKASNLSDSTVFAFLSSQPNRKITINGSDIVGYDKSKVDCFNCHKLGHFSKECRQPRNQDSRNMNQDSSRRTVNVEETTSNAMVAIDGAGFDWSYIADDEILTNMALMAF